MSKCNCELFDRFHDAVKDLEHCGDYGYMFWNAKQGEVWITLGDGDEVAPNDIVKMFKHIPEVKNVVVEAEYDPIEDEDDPDCEWIRIPGKIGKEVRATY